MKKIFLSILVVVSFLLSSCRYSWDNVEKIDLEPKENLLHVSLFANDLQTKTASRLENNMIKYSWSVSDQVSIYLEQGQFKKVINTTIKNIQGNRADIDLPMPNEINVQQAYKIYGLINANFDSSASSPNFNVATTNFSTQNVADLASKSIMYFKSEKASSLSISVEVKHLGAVFSVRVNNNSNENVSLSSLSIESGVNSFYNNSLNYSLSSSINPANINLINIYSGLYTINRKSNFNLYTWFIPSSRINANTLTLKATLNNKSKQFTLSTNKILEAGNKYNINITYDDKANVSASISLPDMPSVDLN